ncbi:hypothetical protein BKA62DRAFT_707857 [Auriculariales sp. MPI-PUGE-AT-0066]|nr:hypothetical protein BKA62DRAFT_707857 [Auriculariales sp. MPI-PUGE-AT-0066]
MSFMRAIVAIAALLATLRVSLARQIQLDDMDVRLLWTPSVVLSAADCSNRPDNKDCDGRWWTEGQDTDRGKTVHDTWGADTSVSFSFKGSEFTVYGILLDAGARATVMVDGLNVGTFNCATSSGQVQHQWPLFVHKDMDPQVTHQVVIAYDPTANTAGNRLWLGIDYFILEETDDDIPSETVASPTESSTQPSTSQTSLAADHSGSGARQSSATLIRTFALLATLATLAI